MHHPPVTQAERILGLVRPFGRLDLKRAHRDAIGRWHPDRNPARVAEATQMSQRINVARIELIELLEAHGGMLCPLPSASRKRPPRAHSTTQAPERARSADPAPLRHAFHDFRRFGGGLWILRSFDSRPPLPDGWFWARKGRHADMVFTVNPGNAADLVAEVERLWDRSGV